MKRNLWSEYTLSLHKEKPTLILTLFSKEVYSNLLASSSAVSALARFPPVTKQEHGWSEITTAPPEVRFIGSVHCSRSFFSRKYRHNIALHHVYT